MKTTPYRALALLPLAAAVGAQDQGDAAVAARFAPPVRIRAGDQFLGQGRLYPSPVVCNVNGDRLPDVVIGDLPGRVTVALGVGHGDSGLQLGAEQPLKDRRGEQLKFHNW